MIFKELALLSFGKFQNKIIAFQPGLNVIHGQNESGKSTLFQAFIGTIFGFKTERHRYQPWKNPSQYQARLVLETDSHEIQLERNFLEDTISMIQKPLTSQETTTFQGKMAPSGRSAEREIYLKKIHHLFGFSEPDIFKSCLFIEQRSLHQLPDAHTATELKQLISNISEFRYDEIIEALESRYYAITKKNPIGIDKRNDRLIENVQQNIEELGERVRRAHQDQTRLLEIGKKIAEIKEKIRIQDQKVQRLTKSIESLNQLTRMAQQEFQTQKLFSETKKTKSLVETLLLQRKEIDRESPKLNRGLIGAMAMSVLAAPFLTSHIGWLWPLLMVGMLSAWGILHYIHFKKDIQYYDLKDMRLKSQLEVLPSLKQMETEYHQHQHTLHEIKSKKMELEKNVMDVQWISGQDHVSILSKLIATQQTALKNLSYESRALESSYELEKQNYLFLAKGLESPFTLEEDLFDLKEKERHLQTKAQALLTAKNMLREIVVAFRREHLKLLSDHAEAFFQKMVPENLHHFSFNETSLAPDIPSDNPTATFSALSCGTQDQLFFAMKLALIDLLNPSRKLPLFLDDPFVNFDHARRQKALQILKTCAKERQIFLFCYDTWYHQQLIHDAHFIDLEKNEAIDV